MQQLPKLHYAHEYPGDIYLRSREPDIMVQRHTSRNYNIRGRVVLSSLPDIHINTEKYTKANYQSILTAERIIVSQTFFNTITDNALPAHLFIHLYPPSIVPSESLQCDTESCTTEPCTTEPCTTVSCVTDTVISPSRAKIIQVCKQVIRKTKVTFILYSVKMMIIICKQSLPLYINM